jgi:hypothetical protein
MSVITIFDYFKRVKSCLPLVTIFMQIKTGKYKSKIENLRRFCEEDVGDTYDQQKKVVPLFSVAGNFKTINEKLEMISYSGNLLLEIPYLNERDLKTVKMLVANDPYVMACFESALGNGLVFIIRSNGVVEEHEVMFKLALKYYKSLTGVNHFSMEGKSIRHICMVSLDEHAYIGMEAKSFSKHIKSRML